MEHQIAEYHPGKRPAPRGTAFYPRKRANTACQVCRARKTKCDNAKPSCSYCVKVGTTCIQSPVDLSSFDPASLKILQRLDDIEQLLVSSTAALDLSDKAEDIPTLCQPRSNATGANTGKLVLYGNVLPDRTESVLRWPIFMREPSGPSSQVLRNVVPDTIAAPSHSGCSLAALLEMEPQGINAILDNFFFYVHCKNPILDEIATRRLVNDAFLDGLDWSPSSCLAMVICALGSIATPFGSSQDTKPGSEAYHNSQVFFQAAQKRIGSLLVRSDIIGAQCLFLSGVYMVCVFQQFYAWRFFSQALAACQRLPFLAHAQELASELDISSSPGSPDTYEQAVYWSAWKSERELSMELSLPDFNIAHTGSALYPHFFPNPPQPLGSPKNQGAQRQRASWLFYLAEIYLRRLSSSIAEEITALHQIHASPATFIKALGPMVAEYETQIQAWSESLPAELSATAPPQEDEVCRFVLRGHLIDMYELIYWPWVMAYIGTTFSQGTPDPEIEEKGQKGLQLHIQRIYVNEPGFLHRHHGTVPLIRTCTRSAFVLVAGGLAGCELPSGWQEAISKTMGLLTIWQNEMAEAGHWVQLLQREYGRLSGSYQGLNLA
ncbi:uncharacterized protein N7446_000299 [Penicillium canescens]|uniref:uncharacterized protein n=1 Tax=Penicillium canescens TaxID=5083 RepID=UPI0026E00037|nr:uncharacterized protein N7446_000299 [Penicillium canescens]KAJ6077363.1 hypothetical protein N7446_000299 [Penicillium canescens]